MSNTNNEPATHSLLRVVKFFIGKLRQNPDVYPIKYYKKGRQFRRNWQGVHVK